MRITIVDYGAGNLPSVERALESLGAKTERAVSKDQVRAANALVLPGVGHFSALVAGLRRMNLTPCLRDASRSGVPILGICLGLHALFTSSAEAPGEPGLNLIRGKIQALPTSAKIPHIGWNQVKQVQTSILLRGIPEDTYFYFAHSYAAPAAGKHSVGICNHGVPFAAVIERRNLLAVQFHPEKSGDAGAEVLRNFLESVR